MKTLKKVFFGFWYRLFGWRIIGDKPNDIRKYVIVVAPHTSNFDFFVGLAVKHMIDLHSHFLAKNSLFKIPVVGWFFRAIGGHPVDRSKNTNLVDQVVELFHELDDFVMTVTPEATRSYKPKWKTGFYRIAEKAQVPIVMVGFNYRDKYVEFKEPFMPSGDMDVDFEKMKAYFRAMPGRHPEKGVQ
jgi:1-acyl-sn-glycerol-3-phosphate acyltransferase